jgi:putative oxidoreductase
MNATALSSTSHAPAQRFSILRTLQTVSHLLDKLQAPFALATRIYVSTQFLQSGWLKITSWQTTLSLFHDEYHVPLLPPDVAAVVGTFGELFFPVLVILGLFGRLSALGLFAVNAMAVISYSHVLFSEGFEAALGQHVLWGFMLAMLAVYGPGPWSADRVIARRTGTQGGW